MPSEGLAVELSVREKRALKEIDAFVAKAKKKLESLEVNFGFKKSGGGTEKIAKDSKASFVTVSKSHDKMTSRIRTNEKSLADFVKRTRDKTAQQAVRTSKSTSAKQIAETRRRETTIAGIESASASRRSAVQRRAVNQQAKGNQRIQQSVLMVQQAVEDFSFAGFRGASNNIAMLASMLGGPAGLIAL